jgi:hypothetical protein
MESFKKLILTKWLLVLKVLPVIVFILLLKLVVNNAGWEFLSLSPLFNSIIAANVFLLGFLLSGTLSDYKESERLPGELAASIETISDEAVITYKNKKSPQAKKLMQDLYSFNSDLQKWFYKGERTVNIMSKLASWNDHFLAFEKLTQPNFIVRLKQEQQSIRRILIRIHTIRETSFVQVGYAIAEMTTFLLVIGFIFAKIDPFYESLFFVGISTFLMIYINVLIKDLDNPFDHYSEGKETALVSLHPLTDLEPRLKERLKKMK